MTSFTLKWEDFFVTLLKIDESNQFSYRITKKEATAMIHKRDNDDLDSGGNNGLGRK